MDKVVIADKKTDLRRGVDFIGVTVNFVVHDGNGKILLQKRSQNCRDEQGKWDVGGGALEFGEQLADAVRREVKEELMVDADEITFVSAYEALRDNNGTPTHWMAFMHFVKVDPNLVKIGEPHKIDEIGWFTSKDLPEPRHSMFDKSYFIALSAGIVT